MRDICYYVRRYAIPEEIRVTKMVDGSPVITYRVTGRVQCDCPGATHHNTQCKHLKILKLWSELGEPDGVAFRVEKGVVLRDIEVTR